MKAARKFGSVLPIICFLLIIVSVRGHTLDTEERVPPPDIPVKDWLRHGDRNDFRWKVEVGQPYLTFHQRWVVHVVARFRAGSLREGGLSVEDLHFVIKVASEDGHWFPGQSYSRFEPPSKLAGGDEIRSISSVYAKPGNYRIAVMAYDRIHHEGNLWQGSMRVLPTHRDQLSGMDNDFPAIEFLQSPPSLTVASPLSIFRDPWDFGHGSLTMPVSNEHPVQVDIVANFSLSNATRLRHSEAPDWVYQLNAARITEISRTLSEVRLKHGCIRFTALDLSRQEVFADGIDVTGFDWSIVRDVVQARERNKIDVNTLVAEKKAPAFLVARLTKLAADPPRCTTADAEPPVRILILVSDNFLFPLGTEMVRLARATAWSRCYHVELVPIAGPRWDDLDQVLKPLNSKKLETSSPADFRKILGRLIRDLQDLPQESAGH